VTNALRQQHLLQADIQNPDLSMLSPVVEQKALRVRWMRERELIGDYCPLRASQTTFDKVHKAKHCPSGDDAASFYDADQSQQLTQASFFVSPQPLEVAAEMSVKKSKRDSIAGHLVPFDIAQFAGGDEAGSSDTFGDCRTNTLDSIEDSGGFSSRRDSEEGSSATDADATEAWMSPGQTSCRHGRQLNIQGDSASRRYRHTSPVSERLSNRSD